jgi:hypothetical protein
MSRAADSPGHMARRRRERPQAHSGAGEDRIYPGTLATQPAPRRPGAMQDVASPRLGLQSAEGILHEVVRKHSPIISCDARKVPPPRFIHFASRGVACGHACMPWCRCMWLHTVYAYSLVVRSGAMPAGDLLIQTFLLLGLTVCWLIVHVKDPGRYQCGLQPPTPPVGSWPSRYAVADGMIWHPCSVVCRRLRGKSTRLRSPRYASPG